MDRHDAFDLYNLIEISKLKKHHIPYMGLTKISNFKRI